MIFEDLTDARTLIEVASNLSFAKAGRKLEIPAATVSRRIARLELAANARLFERTTRSVRVTEAGRLLVRHAERMLAEADAASVTLEAMSAQPQGRIRIAAPVILGQAVLGPVIDEFLNVNRDCDVFADFTNRRVDLVEEGFDLVFRVREPGPADLIVRRLGEATTGLYAPNRAQAKQINVPDDLANESVGIIQPSDQTSSSITFTKCDGQSSSVDVDLAFTTTNPWVLLNAMEQRELFAILPRIVGDAPEHADRLVSIMPDWHVHKIEVFAVWASRRLMRPAVRAFIDIAVPRIQNALH